MPRRLKGGTYEIPDAEPGSPPPPPTNIPHSVRLRPHEEWLLVEIMRRTNYSEADIWRMALADFARKEGVTLREYPFPVPGEIGYKNWKRDDLIRRRRAAAEQPKKEST